MYCFSWVHPINGIICSSIQTCSGRERERENFILCPVGKGSWESCDILQADEWSYAPKQVFFLFVVRNVEFIDNLKPTAQLYSAPYYSQ